MNPKQAETVVVGGGAAGLSAALVLGRARRSVVVVDSGRPRNAPATHMQGFLSRDGMPPGQLLETGRREVLSYGGAVIADRVERIEPLAPRRFAVALASGLTLEARAVLIATGLRDEMPDVPGVTDRWGKDVLHCPYCHGYEVRDLPIGLLGGAEWDRSVHQALLLRQWSSDVVFFPHHGSLSDDERKRLAARRIRIVEGEVTGLAVTGDRLRGVRLADGDEVPRTALFVSPRFLPNDQLLRSLRCRVGKDGWVSVDSSGRTTIDGVFAAGNVVDPRAQVITAAGAGSAAAIAVNTYLVEADIEESGE